MNGNSNKTIIPGFSTWLLVFDVKIPIKSYSWDTGASEMIIHTVNDSLKFNPYVDIPHRIINSRGNDVTKMTVQYIIRYRTRNESNPHDWISPDESNECCYGKQLYPCK